MTRFKNYSKFITNCKWFIVYVIIFTFIEALGPIIFNIEQDYSTKHIFSVLCFAAFHASIIIGILSLFGKRYPATIVIISFIYALFAYANLLYHRSFHMFFPLSMLFEFGQLDGLANSILALMRLQDLLYLVLCVILLYCGYKRWHLTNFDYKHHLIVWCFCATLTFFPVFYISNIVLGWNINTYKNSFIWTCDNNPVTCYTGFGLLPILSYQLQNHKHIHSTINDIEISNIDNLFQQNIKLTNVKLDQISHKHNIIIILLESLNTSCISPVTMPTLYSLSRSQTSLFCPNVYQLSQAAASIGGQFVVMTGLHGLRQSVFSTEYSRNTYPSIVKELKSSNDYYAYTVISTHKYYWRQNTVSASIGMDEIIDQKTNKSTCATNINGWVDDKIVFNHTITNIPSSKQRFCALVVTSNMHAPYDVDMTIDCDAKFEDIADPQLHEYMRRARYLDDQIAAFINELKTRGLYEDTLIVVTSDHQVPEAYCSDAMRKYLSPYIPAIFINTGADWAEQNERNKDVVFCHSQVYPTMLQLMGLRPEKYAGLFPPMTNIEATQEYDFANCAYETTTDERIKQIYDIEEKIIRSSYFGVME